MATRESIWAAVFAKIAATLGVVTASRKLVMYDEVPHEQQPALFIAQTGESHRNKAGMPAVLTLKADLYLYTNTGGNPTLVASSQINDMLDALDAALQPDDVARGRCTLGGLVQHAWLDGDTVIAEGQNGAQAVSIIPVAILVNL